MNLWPPFLGAGIHVKYISEDWRKIVTTLRITPFNANYMGTHFGGSLFAMADPFYMLMLIKNLGKDYNVWDKTGTIEFIKPVKEKVQATFTLNSEQLEQIRRSTANGGKHFETFAIDVVDKDSRLVARVQKTIYIRRKPSINE